MSSTLRKAQFFGFKNGHRNEGRRRLRAEAPQLGPAAREGQGELLHLAVAAVRVVELPRRERAVGSRVLGSCRAVLPHGRQAGGRDRIGGLHHRELRHPGTAERLAL